MDVDTRESGPNPAANYAVLRVKRSLWNGGSYIGAMGIDKRSDDPTDSFNQTVGVDARLVFFKDLALTGYAARTRTPGVAAGQASVGAGLTYRSNWLDIQAEHRKIDPYFSPQVGSWSVPTASAILRTPISKSGHNSPVCAN